MSYPPPPPGSMPPPGGPPGYPPYGAGAYEHPQGTTILVLGILSLVFCQILGPFAWVMGNNALKEIDASGAIASNRGSIVAGRVCGIISSVLMIIGVVVLGAMMLVFAFGGVSS